MAKGCLAIWQSRGLAKLKGIHDKCFTYSILIGVCGDATPRDLRVFSDFRRTKEKCAHAAPLCMKPTKVLVYSDTRQSRSRRAATSLVMVAESVPRNPPMDLISGWHSLRGSKRHVNSSIAYQQRMLDLKECLPDRCVR
jgi:hypothetical protein